jgi:hypothetical protein
MTVTDILSQGKVLLNGNAHTVLTTMGVAGIVGTSYLTGKATFKAAELIAEKEQIAEESLSRKEKVQVVWQLYIPPAVIGAATIVAVVAANRVAAKKIAALAIASGVTERAFQEYKDKVIEKVTKPKEEDIRAEIAKDRIVANPVGTNEIILAGTGDVLCFDMLTGRYFQNNIEGIRRAENNVNFEIAQHMYCSLSRFYDEIGLPPTGFSDTVGFNLDRKCEVKISTVMSTDNRPCAAIDFHFLPTAEYAKLYS